MTTVPRALADPNRTTIHLRHNQVDLPFRIRRKLGGKHNKAPFTLCLSRTSEVPGEQKDRKFSMSDPRIICQEAAIHSHLHGPADYCPIVIVHVASILYSAPEYASAI